MVSAIVGRHRAIAPKSRRNPATCLVAAVLVLALATIPLGRAEPVGAAVSRMVGVTLPGVPADLTGLNTLAAELGRKPTTVMWYSQWSFKKAFPAAAASQVADWGATPEITWEPWDPFAGVIQPDYTLARISSGAFDSYLTSWAKAIKTWGRPLRMRFAHEMNGNWYPWAEGVNGNAAGSYVAAWNHVRRIFSRQRATNVTWIWSPNVPFPGSVNLSQLFPGDAAVNEVALDGYNWSTLYPWSSWTSFANVFNAGFTQLRQLSTRPISVGEVGCPEIGGSKAQWITDMWTTLTGEPGVRGLVWFDYNKEADWRIDSSTSSTAAFATGMGPYLAG